MGSLPASGFGWYGIPRLLWIFLGAALLASCAVVHKEAPPADSSATSSLPSKSASEGGASDLPSAPLQAASTGVPPAGEAKSSATLEQETLRVREQAEAQDLEDGASQTRSFSKEEVEARTATRKPARKQPDGEAVPLPVEEKMPTGERGLAVVSQDASPLVSNSPFVFVVTVASKDSSHPFFGVGSKTGFVVNGVQGKELVMVRGKTYTFKVNSNVQHDFYISLSKVGWGAATYSKGVKGNFTYRGIVTVSPDSATPDTLYYQCRNHKSMGGVIHVINEGEDVSVRKAAAEKAQAVSVKATPAARSVSKDQVNQKMAFADMFINKSQAARRISGSGNAGAFEMYQAAQARFEDSRAALDAGRLEEALALVDESLRLMSEASRRVPSETDLEGLKERYKELLEGVRTFEGSYQRNRKRLAKQKGRKTLPQLDLEVIHSRIDRAQQLAGEENYAEAVRILSRVQDKLNTALTEMLHEETMSYELVFETPKEEYEYELARYLSYEELIPLAIEQRRPSQQTVELMNRFVTKAKGIKDQALPTAAKGDYKTAILMLQGATSHIQRALRLAGVR